MPKGIPDSYDSSHPHTSKSNPEPHVDINRRDERGKADPDSKTHVRLEDWVWEKPNSQRDSGNSESKGVVGGFLSGLGNIFKGGKVDDDP